MLQITILAGFKCNTQTKLRLSAQHCQTVFSQCIIKYKGPLYKAHPWNVLDLISEWFKWFTPVLWIIRRPGAQIGKATGATPGTAAFIQPQASSERHIQNTCQANVYSTRNLTFSKLCCLPKPNRFVLWCMNSFLAREHTLVTTHVSKTRRILLICHL